MLRSLAVRLARMTPVYPMLRTWRRRRAFAKFSEEDAQRAAFYAQFMASGDLVFDVGANMGNRTKVFLSLQARVVGCEPQAQCADFLQEVLAREGNFTLVRQALGNRAGKTEMFVSSSHVLSTLSADWIGATQQSGRFAAYEWATKQAVEVTTLDQAIREYGKPSFIKVDVEGYEAEVLAGLSEPVDYISIEFVPETIEGTFRCIDHMTSIARAPVFQLSLGESMAFAWPDWVVAAEAKQILAGVQSPLWGDVYIRCT